MSRVRKTNAGPVAMLLLVAICRVAGAGAGPYPPEILAWDEATKAAQCEAGKTLVAELVKAIERGDAKYTAQKGHYRFPDMQPGDGGHFAHIFLRNAKNLTIDFSGSTLWFARHGFGFWLADCSGVTIRNATMDWDPLPFTQGALVNVDTATNEMAVKLNAGYERFTPEMHKEPADSGGVIWINFFDPQTRRLLPGKACAWVLPFWHQPPADGIHRAKTVIGFDLTLKDLALPAGTLVSFQRVGGGAFIMGGCADIVLEDLSIYTTPGGSVFNEYSGKGGNTYRRCRVQPRPGTNRILATRGDVWHSCFMERGPRVFDCVAEAIGDDGMNVYGNIGTVIAQEAPTVLRISQLGWRAVKDLKPKLRLNFFSGAAEGFAFIGERTSVSAEAAGHEVRVTLDAPIKVPDKAVYMCDDYVGAGTVVKGSTFRNGAVRGLLVQSLDAVIEDNRFEWFYGPAIQLVPEFGFAHWQTGTHNRGVRIRNNRFTDICLHYPTDATGAIDIAVPGDVKTTRWQEDILIEKNKFERSGWSAVRLIGARNVNIQDNSFRGFGQQALPVKLAPNLTAAQNGRVRAIDAVQAEQLKLIENNIGAPGPHGEAPDKQ